METLFHNFIENLELVIKQLKDGESTRKPSEEFQLDAFWTQLGGTVKVISHEATKMAISFSQPPLPSCGDCEVLIGGMERGTLALVSIYYSLPLHFGSCLRKSTRLAIINIVDEVKSLALTITDLAAKQDAMNLQTTGSVWDACDKISLLPKDNKQAVQIIIKNNFGLVKDALEEMEEALKSEGEEDQWMGLDDSEDMDQEDTWTEDDRTLITPCLGLVKVSRAFLKKTSGALQSNGQCDSMEYITQMDSMAEIAERLSPEVDNFVSGLYAPLQHDKVKSNAHSFADLLKEALEVVKTTHLCKEPDQQWIEFLTKAVDHNLGKIDGLVK